MSLKVKLLALNTLKNCVNIFIRSRHGSVLANANDGLHLGIAESSYGNRS